MFKHSPFDTAYHLNYWIGGIAFVKADIPEVEGEGGDDGLNVFGHDVGFTTEEFEVLNCRVTGDWLIMIHDGVPYWVRTNDI